MAKLLIIRTLIIIFCCITSFVTLANSLRVVTENLPPYQIVRDNKLIGGTSAIIMKELLKRTDLNVDIEILPWARAYKTASSEPNVVIFSMARNKERETHFHWLLKLKKISYRFFKLASQQNIKAHSIEELQNNTVVTVRNSYESIFLINKGFIEGKNLILTSTYDEAWKMLLKGRADYTYAYELIENSVFQKLNITMDLFEKVLDMGDTSELYIAANAQTAPELLQKLRVGIQSMIDDGTIQKI